eukprot:GILK01004262.1.p1 GENE.GILK01004262.1~~GILK01004262.1.p1  ORF type:complete len:520 (-),score=147.75 GILK01004262.1:259-1818(-)
MSEAQEDYSADFDADEMSVEQPTVPVKQQVSEPLPKSDSIDNLNGTNQEVVDKLKKANSNLRQQLKELSGALDRALTGAKKGKAAEPDASTDSAIQGKEKELRLAHKKLEQYRKDIAAMKKQITDSANLERVVKLDNQLKEKELLLAQLQDENKSLQKIQREQSKALEQATAAGDVPAKLRSVLEDLRVSKERLRELQAAKARDEKVMKAQHEQFVNLEEKCRKLTAAIKSKKGDEEPKTAAPTVTEDQLQSLEKEIRILKDSKKSDEKKYKIKFQQSLSDIKELRLQIETLTVQLREKDQECRLNALKLKELKRSFRHGALKPMDRVPSVLKDDTNTSTADKSVRSAFSSSVKASQIVDSASDFSEPEDVKATVRTPSPPPVSTSKPVIKPSTPERKLERVDSPKQVASPRQLSRKHIDANEQAFTSKKTPAPVELPADNLSDMSADDMNYQEDFDMSPVAAGAQSRTVEPAQVNDTKAEEDEKKDVSVLAPAADPFDVPAPEKNVFSKPNFGIKKKK